MSVSTLIVIGSTGPIGVALIEELQRRSVNVIGVSRSTVPALDVSSRRAVDSLLAERRPRTLVYLETPSPYALTPDVVRAGIRRFTGVVQSAVSHGVKRFIYVSSAAVYGTSNQLEERFSTKTPTQGVSHYANLKLSCEHVLRTIGEPSMECSIIRVFNVYGPGSARSLIEQIIVGEAKVYDSTTYVRDYIRVEAAAHAIAEVALCDEAPPSVVNVGSGRGVSNAEILNWCPPRLRSQVTVPASSDISVSVADVPVGQFEGDFPSLRDYIRSKTEMV
jgi:nucleoside-diphosphate-sugar epimerase